MEDTHWLVLDQILQKWFENEMISDYNDLNWRIMNHKDNTKHFHHKPVFLSGSSVEIGAVCRCITGDEVDLEFDIMEEHGWIASKSLGERLLVPVEGLAGYFYLQGDPDGSILYPHYKLDHLHGSEKISLLIQELTKSDNSVVDTNIIKSVYMRNEHETVCGPSCTGEFEIMESVPFIEKMPLHFLIVGMEAGIVSYDLVFCFALTYFPDYMAYWLTNWEDENWPYIETRKLIRDRGIHIVPKDDQALPNTWRISTSASETILFQSLTPIQRQVYFIFKFLFYAYFKGGDVSWYVGQEVKSLPSYLVKTLFFHYMQSKTSVFWKEVKDILVIATRDLFSLLQNSLVTKHCQNFFIPEMRIIQWENIPEDCIENMKSKCAMIIENPSDCYNKKMATFRADIVVPLTIHSLEFLSNTDESELAITSILDKHFQLKDVDFGQISSQWQRDIKSFMNGLGQYYLHIDNLESTKHVHEKEIIFIRKVRATFCKKLYKSITETVDYQFSKWERALIELYFSKTDDYLLKQRELETLRADILKEL